MVRFAPFEGSQLDVRGGLKDCRAEGSNSSTEIICQRIEDEMGGRNTLHMYMYVFIL